MTAMAERIPDSIVEAAARALAADDGQGSSYLILFGEHRYAYERKARRVLDAVGPLLAGRIAAAIEDGVVINATHRRAAHYVAATKRAADLARAIGGDSDG